LIFPRFSFKTSNYASHFLQSCLIASILFSSLVVPGDSLAIGQSLLIGQTLVSAQKIFELGFFSSGNNTYLGIWYHSMKLQPIVWVANRETPITGGNGSLTFTASSLDLLDRGGAKVWSSGALSAVDDSPHKPSFSTPVTSSSTTWTILYGKLLIIPVTRCCRR
jgi:hypothetical protein